VKIKDVPHEFSTIENVLEDVTEIVLNIKQLCVKMESAEPQKLVLEAKKKGEVKAQMIQLPVGVEIINPDLTICTIVDEPANVYMEILVKRGRGYVTAEEHIKQFNIEEIGIIPVDSNFSPVKRVAYKVENTRVGRRSDYDKLILEVWTNGVVTPEEALVESAKILRKHLNPFIFYQELSREVLVEEKPAVITPEEEEKVSETELLDMPINVLELPGKISDALTSAGIQIIRDLVTKTEAKITKLKGIDKSDLKEIKAKLKKFGLSLGKEE
jgi:DNA-directed RNA polymerase subunit alpha